jgi:hypothetical protein
MYPSTVPHLLKYNITPVAEGVLLRIWEPAERNEVRVKPFLFMLKYRMSSEAEARRFLTSYLSLYQSTVAQASQEQESLGVDG